MRLMKHVSDTGQLKDRAQSQRVNTMRTHSRLEGKTRAV